MVGQNGVRRSIRGSCHPQKQCYPLPFHLPWHSSSATDPVFDKLCCIVLCCMPLISDSSGGEPDAAVHYLVFCFLIFVNFLPFFPLTPTTPGHTPSPRPETAREQTPSAHPRKAAAQSAHIHTQCSVSTGHTTAATKAICYQEHCRVGNAGAAAL